MRIAAKIFATENLLPVDKATWDQRREIDSMNNIPDISFYYERGSDKENGIKAD